MVVITKEEAMEIKKRFPNVHIVRTMKHKSNRHRYYCEENWKVMRFLNEKRGLIPENESGRRQNGDRYGNKKNRNRDRV